MRLFDRYMSPESIPDCLTRIFVPIAVIFLVISATGAHDAAKLGKTGLLLLGIAVCLFLVSRRQKKKEQELTEAGTYVPAQVVAVNQLRYINFSNGVRLSTGANRRSPFRVYYRYEYDGQTFHGRSRLFWEHPKLDRGDSISVLVDESNPKKNYYDACGK